MALLIATLVSLLTWRANSLGPAGCCEVDAAMSPRGPSNVMDSPWPCGNPPSAPEDRIASSLRSIAVAHRSVQRDSANSV
jgi:hypothetical protein